MRRRLVLILPFLALAARSGPLRAGRSSSGGFTAGQQSQLAVLPKTVYIFKTDLAQPIQLDFRRDALVGGVFIGQCGSEGAEEGVAQARGGGLDVFEVGKDSAGGQPLKHLLVEGPFALIRQVMNGEGRNDRVEYAQVGQRMIHIMLDHAHGGVIAKALAGGGEHGGRKVQGHAAA